ncbi:PEST proteolytic signal-containing nuclear protein [Gryllus bimaculatus]|nr:PEST proteolytic signal-containing nuclear protein [Gryllus bimaculatus]
MSKRSSDGAVTKGSPQSVDKASTNKEGDEAPKRQKIMINYTDKQFKPGEKSEALLKKGIQMKLGSGQKSSQGTGVVQPQSKSVAAVFNVDEEEEPKEMPPEARMRMRNIGRETPTSAGPNSFGKTKQGFCDAKKMFEKNMKKAMDSSESGKDAD